jgi:hypothetical protein
LLSTVHRAATADYRLIVVPDCLVVVVGFAIVTVSLNPAGERGEGGGVNGNVINKSCAARKPRF